MKKYVLIFVFVTTLLNLGGVERIGSGDTVICGYVVDAWFSYPCMGPWPMDTCDGYRVFLWDPPEGYKDRYMVLVNPKWEERCDEACGGCDSYIADCEEAFYISSCAECSSPDDPCQNMFCGEECFGCDLWMTECDYGKCVKDYIIERDSRNCGCGDPCEDITCEPECYGCDYWAMECDDGDCVKDYIIERDSRNCGCGDPCRGKNCPPECYGCDYWAMECDDGDCVKDYIIERDSRNCGCGEEVHGSREAENAREKLYENYAKALDPWYWDNEGNEILLMFGQDFSDSFTTSFGILKSVAKQAALGKYSSAELITKEVVSLSGYLSCKDMSWTLSQTYLKAKLPYDFQERMITVSELIRQGKTGDAQREITTLCSYLQEAYQHVDAVGDGVPGANHENTVETAETIIRAAIGFLEAECQEHSDSTCRCHVPEVRPEPEPEPDTCVGTSSVCFIMLFGAILKCKQ